MTLRQLRRIVITGGPGAGKTSLIDALERRGFARTIEAGRAIIQDQVRTGGDALPWGDREAYARLMLAWEMRSWRDAEGLAGPVFFDRGVPDIVGYLRLSGLPVPPPIETAARRLRYDRVVFIAPPWPEIFTGDAERKQDFAEAERTHVAMATVYPAFGYDLVELPRASIEDRVAFVLNACSANPRNAINPHGSRSSR
jgi:predicted ATPase